jgi:hypothetical protein
MRFFGGATVGWTHATWPFVVLNCSSENLRLYMFPFSEYIFTPEQVKSIEEVGEIPYRKDGNSDSPYRQELS